MGFTCTLGRINTKDNIKELYKYEHSLVGDEDDDGEGKLENEFVCYGASTTHYGASTTQNKRSD